MLFYCFSIAFLCLLMGLTICMFVGHLYSFLLAWSYPLLRFLLKCSSFLIICNSSLHIVAINDLVHHLLVFSHSLFFSVSWGFCFIKIFNIYVASSAVVFLYGLWVSTRRLLKYSLYTFCCHRYRFLKMVAMAYYYKFILPNCWTFS